MSKIYFLLFISFLLAGCSAISKTSKDLDLNAKNLSPTDDKALVYIVRPSFYGGMEIFKVAVNGNSIGSASGKRFLFTLLEPGMYTFSSIAENQSELPIVIEAGKTYFLEMKVQTGLFSARTKLVRINEQEGQFKLQKCFLSKRNTYNQF